MSGLFKSSQLNWACLTKEAYAIYMSVRKLAYYLEDADITLQSDHLPLRKFLAKNTLNSKVNNWAIEISPFRIQFEYIKGIKNTLADTISCLINIDPTVQQPPEEEGYEFGYYVFDTLPPMTVEEIFEQSVKTNNLGLEPDLAASIELISQDKLKELQAKDDHCMKIAKLLQEGKLQDQKPNFKQGNILYKVVPEGEKAYEVMVLPKALIGHVLMESHNNLGHNGIKRMYALVR